MKLNVYASVSVMWNTFHRYATKDPIEVDTTLIRSTANILKMIKCLKLYIGDEISY